jgi:hypothetical protein
LDAPATLATRRQADAAFALAQRGDLTLDRRYDAAQLERQE